MLHLTLRPRRLARILLLIVLGLTVASLASQLVQRAAGPGKHFVLADFFSVDQENNLPTWYQSVTLLTCAALLGIVAGLRRQAFDPFARHWAVLTAVFAYLSLDEMASIHERIFNPLRHALCAHIQSGALHFGWLPFGAVCALSIGLASARFLFHLPPVTRRWFLLAGSLYVGGAVGMEWLGDLAAACWGARSLPYLLTATLEEAGEMLGIVAFVYALTTYWDGLGQTVHISVCSCPHPQPLHFPDDA